MWRYLGPISLANNKLELSRWRTVSPTGPHLVGNCFKKGSLRPATSLRSPVLIMSRFRTLAILASVTATIVVIIRTSAIFCIGLPRVPRRMILWGELTELSRCSTKQMLDPFPYEAPSRFTFSGDAIPRHYPLSDRRPHSNDYVAMQMRKRQKMSTISR